MTSECVAHRDNFYPPVAVKGRLLLELGDTPASTLQATKAEYLVLQPRG